MEGVSGVRARLEALQARLATLTPEQLTGGVAVPRPQADGAFQRHLEAQLAAGADRSAAGDVATAAASDAFSAPSDSHAQALTAHRRGAAEAVTLGQMLQARGGAPAPPAAAARVLDAAPAHRALAPRVDPVAGEITSGFGMREHPISGREAFHAGVDFGAPTGTPVQTVADGHVTFAGPRGGYGNLVIVEHGDGLETYHAHLDAVEVRAGAHITAGARLGTVGATGAATGPHLHFEVRQGGEPVDPMASLAGPTAGLRRS